MAIQLFKFTQSAKSLAMSLGWDMEFALGYVDGIAYRNKSIAPPRESLSGTSEYALGVQIGYNYGLDYLEWSAEVEPMMNFKQGCR